MRNKTMRNRDFFLPSITTLILSGLVWFLSCAHQNRFREDQDATFEQVAEQKLSEEADLENQSAQEAPQQEQSVNKNDFALLSEDEKESKTVLKAKQAEENAEATQAPSENTDTAAASETKEASADQAPEETKPEPELVTAQPQVEPETKESEVQPVVATKKLFSLKVPKIPGKAIARRGSKLNRFYFVRKGDTPKKVSELIYSDPKFAPKLVRWNGKAWAPGQVLFYSSPINPKDKRMASFYQERNIQPDEYQVRPGDWLTRIAKKKLGSPRSWKELAVLNGLKSPHSLEVGQTLAVYPKDLTGPQEQRMDQARATEPAVNAPKQAPVVQNMISPDQAPPSVEQAPVTPPPAPANTPSVNVAPPAQEQVEEPAPEQTMASINIMQIAEQNSIAILIGAAILILLLALAARKKRQKMRSQSSSGSDDNEAMEENRSRFRKR